MSFFLERQIWIKNILEVELELANYATKSKLENVRGVDASDFAKVLLKNLIISRQKTFMED